MKGFVPTPPNVVDQMVAKLFAACSPNPQSTVLDPGCGTGAFIEGVIRWCQRHGTPLPRIVGVESNPEHLRRAHASIPSRARVTLLEEDFLAPRSGEFDFIIGNPPYVSITELSWDERSTYRRRYTTAAGRFDLYLLFFEQALRLLKPGGRLVFITPEKFSYVQTAAPLRRVLGEMQVEEIHLLDECTFEGLTTYPAITTVTNSPRRGPTRVILRTGDLREAFLPRDGASWLPVINASSGEETGVTLADIALRISAGVATGADQIFVRKAEGLEPGLATFAYPTLAGREIRIGKGADPRHVMLVPYSGDGVLLSESELSELHTYLNQPDRRARLVSRTCVARKPWYAFHETPPLHEILRPKILCKDISSRPYFIVDEAGRVVPRHSVYYIVPRDPEALHEICAYLNSESAQRWLLANCQRAANGFLRLQSHALKRLPVPSLLGSGPQLALASATAGG